MLTMTDDAIEWVKIQRTHLDGGDNIAAAFEDEIKREAMDIAPYLPEGGRIVSIGTGMGGVELMLTRCYVQADQHPHLMIVDKTAEGEVRAGFGTKMTPFSNTYTAHEFLVSNGLEDEDIAIREPNPAAYYGECDVLVSFLSWCHHYPAATYGAFASRTVRPGGRLIVDVRKNTGGAVALEEYGFTQVGQIQLNGINRAKSNRLVFEKH